jgi:hypothetical protein
MKTIYEDKQLNKKPRRRWLRYFLILFLSLPIIARIYYIATKEYCVREHRKLTDEEFILIALDKVIKSGKVKIHDWDKTPQSYLRHHPGCCRISKGEHLKYGVANVSIDYELSDYWKFQYKKITDHKEIRLSACGFPLSSGAFAGLDFQFPSIRL